MAITGLTLTPKVKLGILALDAIVYAFVLATIFQLRIGENFSVIFSAEGFWVQLFSVLSFSYLLGCYDVNTESFSKIAISKIVAVIFAILFITLINFIFYKERAGLFGRGILIGGSFVYAGLSTFVRYFFWRRYQSVIGKIDVKFLILNKDKELLTADLRKRVITVNYDIIGIENVEKIFTQIDNFKNVFLVLGVDPTTLSLEDQKKLFEKKLKGLKIIDLSEFYETTWANVPIYHLQFQWFLTSDGFGVVSDQLRARVKRLFDLVLSTTLLTLSWPILLLAAIALRFDSKGPVLYQQVRVGKNGKNFLITKLRSMHVDAEVLGVQWAQKNDKRVTRVGKFLRKTRIDELPQLWSVLKGDMSFIGPRPERPEFVISLEKEIPFYQMRHMVRPGLTGWAQVCYPYGSNIEDAKEKLQFEIFYIKHHSLWLDLLILLRTIKVVLKMKGS